jgi:hypothetical protein
MGIGWLFGRRKDSSKVPLGGRTFDEKTFQFSKKFGGETLIEPESLQEAAGYKDQFALPDESSFGAEAEELTRPKPKLSGLTRGCPVNPVYVKVDVYQKILEELDGMKSNIRQLQEACRNLETSEFNEEHNFGSLKSSMKSVHDKVLQVDKMVFKCLGE